MSVFMVIVRCIWVWKGKSEGSEGVNNIGNMQYACWVCWRCMDFWGVSWPGAQPKHGLYCLQLLIEGQCLGEHATCLFYFQFYYQDPAWLTRLMSYLTGI